MAGRPPRRVLIVAYYFPPIGGIGSIRAARFARHLPEFGWEPTVIAPDVTPHTPDPTIEGPPDRVVRSASIELSRLARRSDAGSPRPGTRAHTASAGARLRAAVLRGVFPDAQVGWYPGAVAAARRAFRAGSFDAVFTTSFPITAHLVGRTVTGMASLPWVAEFRDPWSTRVPHFPHRRRAERMERSIAARATRLIMPNAPMAEHFGDLWQTDIAVIPNGCEPRPLGPEPVGPPVLAHVGTYYPERQSFAPVWRALADLQAEGARTPRIRWVGDPPPALRGELDGLGISSLLDVTGTVSHGRAVELMASSSILLASGERDPGPVGRGTVAAKLFEYLASHRPIIYVGDEASDAARLLLGHPGCYVVGYEDVAGARRAIDAALSSPAVERDVRDFTVRARTEMLAGVLDSAQASVNSPCSSA
jgi:hypothetical protein